MAYGFYSKTSTNMQSTRNVKPLDITLMIRGDAEWIQSIRENMYANKLIRNIKQLITWLQ